MKEKWQNQHDTGEAPWDYNEFDVDFKEELLYSRRYQVRIKLL